VHSCIPASARPSPRWHVQVESAEHAISSAAAAVRGSSLVQSAPAADPTFEDDVNQAVPEWVLRQPEFQNAEAHDLHNAAFTAADILLSWQVLEEDPSLIAHLRKYSGNVELREVLQEVADADRELASKLAKFAEARVTAASIGVKAPVMYTLLGPKPPLCSFDSRCGTVRGIVPLAGAEPAAGRCLDAVVWVRDLDGFYYAVRTTRREATRFNVQLEDLARHHGASDAVIGVAAVVSPAGLGPAVSASPAGVDSVRTPVRGGADNLPAAGGRAGPLQRSSPVVLNIGSFQRRRLVVTPKLLASHIAQMMDELKAYKGKGYPIVSAYGAFMDRDGILSDAGTFVRPWRDVWPVFGAFVPLSEPSPPS